MTFMRTRARRCRWSFGPGCWGCSFRTAQHLLGMVQQWVEPDGTTFDLMYRSCDAIEADVEAELGRGEATVGYSTCLCHSGKQATPVFDRLGLGSKLSGTGLNRHRTRGGGGGGPDESAGAGGAPSILTSSRFVRPSADRDRVSLNHRTAAWLASYFDLLFAANQRFNPGEKRLLARANPPDA